MKPRGLALQAALAAVLALLAWWLYANLAQNLAARGIASGFAFLWREAGWSGDHAIFNGFQASVPREANKSETCSCCPRVNS